MKYQLKGKQQAFCEMVKLILLILFIAHIIACGALHIQKVEMNTQKIFWFQNFVNQAWYVKYVNSIYWAIITMVTLGYGDITPINAQEKIYTIGVALVGCFILSYSMNSVGEILKGLAKSSTHFKEKMLVLNQYFSRTEVNRDLQLKVIKYYEYMLSQEEENNNEGYNLIELLPTQLKEEVKFKLYENLLMKKKFFSLNFSKKFLHKLSLKFQEEVYAPKSIIYKKGECSNKIYFVLHGKVEIFQETLEKNKQIHIQTKKNKGEMIGEYEYFSGYEREQSARSRSVTNLAFLKKEDFLEVLSEFPLDKEKFQMIQDSFIFLLNQKNGFMCLSCDSFRHKLIQCPYILYQAPKERILVSYQKEERQKLRQNWNRRPIKGSKAIQIQCFVEQLAVLIQQNQNGTSQVLRSQSDLQTENSTINASGRNLQMPASNIQSYILQRQLSLSKDLKDLLVKEKKRNSSIQVNRLSLDNNPLHKLVVKKVQKNNNNSNNNNINNNNNSNININNNSNINISNNSNININNNSNINNTLQAINQNASFLEKGSKQKMSSTQIIEEEQIINPVLQFIIDHEGVEVKEQQQNINSPKQHQHAQKSKLSLLLEDQSILVKKRCSINQFAQNGDDIYLSSIQEEVNNSTDNKLSIESDSINHIPSQFTNRHKEKEMSMTSFDQGLIPKFDLENNHSNQPSQFKNVSNISRNENEFILQGLDDFDKGAEFQVYFPHNNFNSVISKYSVIWKKKYEKLQTKIVIKSKRNKNKSNNIDDINNHKSAFKQMQNITNNQRKNKKQTDSKRQGIYVSN